MISLSGVRRHSFVVSSSESEGRADHLSVTSSHSVESVAALTSDDYQSSFPPFVSSSYSLSSLSSPVSLYPSPPPTPCSPFFPSYSFPSSLSSGPSTWSKTYPIAVTGTRQSPIDIQSEECVCPQGKDKVPLNIDYPKALNELPLKNTGYGWTVQMPKELSKKTCIEGGPLEGKYLLEQFHAHWGSDCTCGSEHTIDGKSFAAEVRRCS